MQFVLIVTKTLCDFLFFFIILTILIFRNLMFLRSSSLAIFHEKIGLDRRSVPSLQKGVYLERPGDNFGNVAKIEQHFIHPYRSIF